MAQLTRASEPARQPWDVSLISNDVACAAENTREIVRAEILIMLKRR